MERNAEYYEYLEEEALRQNAEAEYELMRQAGGYDDGEDMASYPMEARGG